MHRLLLVAGFLLTSFTTTACRDISTGPTAVSIAGTFSLRTVNGSAVPFVVTPANPKIEIVSGQVTLSANGTWTSILTLRVTDGMIVSTQSESSSGTYTLNGTLATFTNSLGGVPKDVTISGDSIIAIDSGRSFVYSK